MLKYLLPFIFVFVGCGDTIIKSNIDPNTMICDCNLTTTNECDKRIQCVCLSFDDKIFTEIANKLIDYNVTCENNENYTCVSKLNYVSCEKAE